MGYFVAGQIVRPLRSFVLRSGEAVDFQALQSAQAWVASDNGIAGAFYGAAVWDKNRSVDDPPDGSGGVYYTLKVWDPATQSVLTLDYGEDFLVLGSIGGVPITEKFASPSPNTANGRLTLNIISTRD